MLAGVGGYGYHHTAQWTRLVSMMGAPEEWVSWEVLLCWAFSSQAGVLKQPAPRQCQRRAVLRPQCPRLPRPRWRHPLPCPPPLRLRVAALSAAAPSQQASWHTPEGGPAWSHMPDQQTDAVKHIFILAPVSLLTPKIAHLLQHYDVEREVSVIPVTYKAQPSATSSHDELTF